MSCVVYGYFIEDLYICLSDMVTPPPKTPPDTLRHRPVPVENDARTVRHGRNIALRQEQAILGDRLERGIVLAGHKRRAAGHDLLVHLHVHTLGEGIDNVGAGQAAQQQGHAEDVLVGVETRRVLGQRHNTVLGSGVGDAGLEAHVAGVGADVDDDTAGLLLLLELLDSVLGSEEGAGEVDGQDAVPELLGAVTSGGEVVHDGGVVDENVETAELGGGSLDELLDGSLVGHVGLLGQEAVGVGLGPFFLDSRNTLLVDVADDNVGTGGEEGLSNDLAETTGGAGNENSLALSGSHLVVSDELGTRDSVSIGSDEDGLGSH